MKTLKKDVSQIDWVGREQRKGKTVSNKCGRDFIYLALNYLLPENYNAEINYPVSIDKQKLLGFPVTPYLAWTQIQFFKIATFLKKENIDLIINKKKVNSYVSFAWGNLFSKITFTEAINEIEKCIDRDIPCAVDISIAGGMMALLDHVMFVYGYDQENLYVIDSHTVKNVGYELIDEKAHLYKLSKAIIRSRWSKFGRVWEMRVIQ